MTGNDDTFLHLSFFNFLFFFYRFPNRKTRRSFSILNNFSETLRALALLEDYHAKLSSVPNNDLQVVMQLVIGVFKSRLFQALVGNFLFIL